MEVQPQLVLLQKTLLNIEGLGRTLDPDLDLWVTAKPFLDRWMSEQVGMRKLVSGIRKQLPYIAERLPEVPDLIYHSLQNMEKSHQRMQRQSESMEQLRNQIRKSSRNLIYAIAVAVTAILVGMWYF